ncbi:MAG: [acyl-carrier-protein] S-malonyltransferase [Candidatus Pelagibacter sp.]|nr:[acyl-carrier-protein] S-malonyltransferase [Candidatus Pelagibacter sp.]OUV87392.1 MAG: [acyl-carrier-protein] S-malonyltransferase [Pelagibacteraceae bacterium TMED136]
MKKCIVFPGQGSQYLGMGKYLYDNFSVSKHIFDEVDDALNTKLTKIIFGDNQNELNFTENTQPAIMAGSIATLEALKKDRGIVIDDFNYCAGHSLGEYSALVAAKSIKLSDAAKILKKRGQAMQNAVPLGQGAMAAILNIQVKDLENFINKNNFSTIEISNDNCPGQCVVSGKKQEINGLTILLKNELKKKAISLPVSAPFHCKMMKPAAEELQNFLRNFEINDPIIPIVSNVSVLPEKLNTEIKKLLIDCVYNRVRWREIIEFFYNNNIIECIECGPGKALTNMFRRFEFNIRCIKIDNIEDIKNYV